MGTDVQDLLRDGLAQVADRAGVPAGLGVRAYGRWRRRRAWRRALFGGGSAGLAVVLVAGFTAAREPSGPGSLRAGTAAGIHNPPDMTASARLVEYTKTVLPPGSPSGLAPPGQPGGMVASPKFTKPEIVQSAYRGKTVATFYARPGDKIFTGLTEVTPARTASTWVTYSNRTWWHRVQLPDLYPPSQWCTRYGVPDPLPQDTAGGTWEHTVSKLLTCRYVQVGGTLDRVDGQAAIRLSQPPVTGINGRSAPTLAKTGTAWALWVSSATFLPIRLTTWSEVKQTNRMSEEVTFQWLPPTRANLATFDLTVPLSYKRVNPPAG